MPNQQQSCHARAGEDPPGLVAELHRHEDATPFQCARCKEDLSQAPKLFSGPETDQQKYVGLYATRVTDAAQQIRQEGERTYFAVHAQLAASQIGYDRISAVELSPQRR